MGVGKINHIILISKTYNTIKKPIRIVTSATILA